MPRDLVIFVANMLQFEHVLKHVDLRCDAVIATGDFDVRVRALDQGLPLIDLWDYLDEKEAEDNEEKAWGLNRLLSEQLRGRLLYRGCDLLANSRIDLFWTFDTVLNTSLAVENLLGTGRVERARVFADTVTPDYFDLPSYPLADTFNASVLWVLNRRGIPVDPLTLGPLAGRPEFFKPTGRSSAKVVPSALPDEVDVISIAEQLGCDEQELLIGTVVGSGRTGWVAVSSDEPRSCMPFLPLQYLRWLPFDYGSLESEVKAVVREIPASLRSVSTEGWGAILENPYLSFVWESLGPYLLKAAEQYAVASFLAESLRPRVAICGYDVYAPGRCASRGFMSRGTAVVAVDHTGLGQPRDGRYNEGAEAHVAVWGEFDERRQRTSRAAGARVEVVGNLQKMMTPVNRVQRQRPHVPEGHRCVLLFTSKTGSGSRMDVWVKPGKLMDCWEGLVGLAERRPGWEFFIKPHPRYDHALFYAQHVLPRHASFHLAEGRPSDVLRQADAAVLVNTPSTVAVEAIAAGVPVLYLRDGMFEHWTSPLEEDGAVVCRSVAVLEEELEKIIGNAVYAAEVCERQRQFLQRAVRASGDEAVRRMLQWVDELSLADGRQPGVVCAQGRWVLDMISSIHRLMIGASSSPEFTVSLADLRGRANEIPPDSITGIPSNRLGVYFLRVVTWGAWTASQPPFRPRILWMVFRALPRSLRPSWSEFRAHLVQTLDVESMAGRRGVMRRLGCRLAAILLAPGRLMNRGRGRDGLEAGA